MAYNDYLHCAACGGKALYWEQWDYIGCAHCPGDLDHADRGVVEVYCPECTTARHSNPDAHPRAHPKPSTVEPATFGYDPDGDLFTVEEGGVRVEYAATDPWGMDIVQTVSPDEEFAVSLPLRVLPMIRSTAARVVDLAARGTDRDR